LCSRYLEEETNCNGYSASKARLLAFALAGALVVGHWTISRMAYAATPVLSETATVGVPSSATKVLSGDFNGDSVPDLIVAIGGSPRNPGYLLLYIGSPTGQYSLINTSYSYTGAFADMAVGDFNGDGKLDVAVFSNSWEIHQQSVHVFLGTGSTTAPFLTRTSFRPLIDFLTLTNIPAPWSPTTSMATA